MISTPEIKKSPLHKGQNKKKLWLLSIIFLIYCLLMMLPWNPRIYGVDLDQSWASALHVAIAKGIQFGSDLVYTYGPYGFIQVDYYFQDTYIYAFGLRLFIALVVWFGLWTITQHCWQRRDRSVLFLIPILGFFPSPVWQEHFPFAVIILPLILYFYVSSSLTPALMLTTLVMALVSLIKHTYLIPSIVFVILITIDEIYRQRRWPRILPIYLIAILFFWIIAGQNIANFPSYIINGLQMVKGFSASMGIVGSGSEVIFYLFSAGLLWFLIAATEWKHRQLIGLLPALALAAILFITFKGAFVRHDRHALQATLNSTPVIMLFVAMLWPEIRSYSWQLGKKIKVKGSLWCGAALLLLFLMGSSILHHYLDYGYGTYSLNMLKLPAIKFSQATALITGQTKLQEKYDQGTQLIRNQNPLPTEISGTVDLYPDEIAVIFAHEFDYQPRPAIQSFAAYTSKLAELNANHLRSNNAAETILFDIKPIDDRLPSTGDGLSWPELLTRYDITDIEGRYLVLKRNQQPRSYSLNPLIEANVAIGEWYEIPEKVQFPIWTKINFHPNILGKLSSTAFRLPAIFMEIETADGKINQYRLITDILDKGFLLSPMLENRWDFLALTTEDWQQRLQWSQVKRIRISSEGLESLLYPNSYDISLSSLDFPRQSFEQVTGWQTWNQKILTGIQPLKGALEKITLPNGEFGWMAHAPMKIQVQISDTAQKLSFGFGIFDGAWQEGATDGVEFRIITHELNGQEKVIFSRRLDPASNPQDRGIQKTTIDLSNIDVHEVIFETLPGETASWDWSYWSELTMK